MEEGDTLSLEFGVWNLELDLVGVSEVLTKKRGLSLGIIRQLHQKLKIPLESLVGTAA